MWSLSKYPKEDLGGMNIPAKYLLSYDCAECLLIGKHVVIMLFSEICLFQILRFDLPLDDSSCCLLILSCWNMLLAQFNNLLEKSNISIVRISGKNPFPKLAVRRNGWGHRDRKFFPLLQCKFRANLLISGKLFWFYRNKEKKSLGGY